jgi:hypothetical protein
MDKGNDLQSAYYVQYGLYIYKIILYRLAYEFIKFYNVLIKIILELIDKNNIVYIDNILYYSVMIDKNVQLVPEVHIHFGKWNLATLANKCKLYKELSKF